MIPSSLLKTLDLIAGAAILAHELAHLRRRDHWVFGWPLAAGLGWWCNPLYWWIRRRLEDEAELACDAWVVAILPRCRRTYAETLIDVCESFSQHRVLAPALGVGGRPGRFLERRLTMILRERVSCRASARGLMVLSCLALLAAPSWTRAQSQPDKGEGKSEATRAEQEQKREAEARVSKAQAVLEAVAKDLAKLQPGQDPGQADELIDVRRVEAEKQVKEAELRLAEAQLRLQKEIAEASQRLEAARRKLSAIGVKRKQLESKGDNAAAASARLADEVRVRLRGDVLTARPQQETAELKRAIEMLIKKQVELESSFKAHPLVAADDAAKLHKALGERLAETVRSNQNSTPADLERRMSQLEAKFDALLSELKSQRAETKLPLAK